MKNKSTVRIRKIISFCLVIIFLFSAFGVNAFQQDTNYNILTKSIQLQGGLRGTDMENVPYQGNVSDCDKKEISTEILIDNIDEYIHQHIYFENDPPEPEDEILNKDKKEMERFDYNLLENTQKRIGNLEKIINTLVIISRLEAGDQELKKENLYT